MLGSSLGDTSARVLRSLIHASLRCAGSQCSEEDIGRVIGRHSITKIRKVVLRAWVASMADPKDEPVDEFAEPPPRQTWLDVWAIARYDLNLTDEQWLDMTPRMFRALQEARIKQFQREEMLVGIVAATIENFSMAAPKKPASPADFMMNKLPPPPELPIGEQIMREMRKLRK